MTTASSTGGVIVFAKAPRPGLAKTRLSPPFTPAQAAALARACLADTLDAVLAADVPRRVLALDGPVGAWMPSGFETISQRGDGFGERLRNAFLDVGGPALLIGMDTPQLSPMLLESAWRRLTGAPKVDAVIGLATDGGWWALGQRVPADVFEGVPMSVGETGSRQLARLSELGLRVALLPTLRDLDDVQDVEPLRRAAPATRFAGIVSGMAGERSWGDAVSPSPR